MDQNAATSSYSEALYYAVEQRNLDLSNELLKAGANVNHTVARITRYRLLHNVLPHKHTPIIAAVENDHLDMVKLLLEYIPNVNDRDATGGQLPLVQAAETGNLEIMKTILAHPGTIANARNWLGDFALAVASSMGTYEAVELLVSHGEHTKKEYSKALQMAAVGGNTDVIRLLLEHGASASEHGANLFQRRKSPLRCALIHGNLDAARLLIRSGGATCEITLESIMTYHPPEAMRWLFDDSPRAILDLEGYWETRYWDAIVAALWFHYFGPDHDEDPPRFWWDITQLSEEGFKMAHKWMVYALSSLLFLNNSNLLLPPLCRLIDPSVALELCEHTGKTPLLLALELFPSQHELRRRRRNAADGIDHLIEWNPDALKVPHPETRRIPLTCAIANRVLLETLQEMITCKNEKWFTASPLQQDPVTLLPNFLLVAAGKDCYSEADIYEFSRDYLPGIISSTVKRSPTQVRPTQGVRPTQKRRFRRLRPFRRRGIKRSLEQI